MIIKKSDKYLVVVSVADQTLRGGEVNVGGQTPFTGTRPSFTETSDGDQACRLIASYCPWQGDKGKLSGDLT